MCGRRRRPRAGDCREDGAAIRFDLTRGEITGRIDVLPCKLFALAVIDSQYAAIAGSDNRIRLVDFEQSRVTQFLDGHTGSINSLIYDRGRLFSGGFDASLKQWVVSPRDEPRLAEHGPEATPPTQSSSR